MTDHPQQPNLVELLKSLLLAFKIVLGVVFVGTIIFIKSLPYGVPTLIFTTLAVLFIIATIFDIVIRWKYPKPR